MQMNDEFENGGEIREEPVEAAEQEETQAEIIESETFEAPEIQEEIQPENEEAAEQPVEAQPVEPNDTSNIYSGTYHYTRPPYQQNPYQQNQYQQNAYQQPPYQQNPYGYAQPQPQTPPKKNNKGVKLFVAALGIIAAIALAIGVAAVSKYVINKKGIKDTGKISSGDTGASLNINSSPVSPTEVNIDGPLSTTAIAAKVRASNVGIVVYKSGSSSAAGEGSGIIMGEDKSGNYTYVITCAHVIDDKGVKVTVQTEDGTSYDADIVGYDIRTDTGVLKIKAHGLPAAEFGDSNALSVGDPVYAVGNPGGVEFFGSFTGGYVASIDRPISSEIGYTMKCIQHSAAISPGNSGGALANQYGQVIGINSQKIASTNYEQIGFAIPISSAKAIIDNLINVGYVPNRPKLGITYYPLSASAQYSMIAQIKGLPAGTLIINEIGSDSSLAGTEARKYDMITKVDGKELTTADVLLELIDNGKVGDKHTLTLCRVNSNYSIDEFEVDITLVEDKGDEIEETTTYQYIDPFEYFNNFGF